MTGQDTSKPAPSGQSGALKLSDIKRPIIWAVVLLVITIMLRGVLMGRWGHIGADGDDVMRLLQIQDYLGGQNWFDTDQYRLGPAGSATDMHWSRLVDAPIIALTHVFDIFMPQEAALNLAISVWPPLSAALFIWAILKAASYYALGYVGARSGGAHIDGEAAQEGSKTFAFSLILLAFFVIPFYRFEPGAIDHHNVQMGLMALAVAGALDPRARFVPHLVSGAAAAISVAIGTEVYILAAALCFYVGLSWILKGDAFVRAAQGFGLGLAGAMAAAFFALTAPQEYGLVKCDSLSLITICAASVGGLGLAAAASAAQGKAQKYRLLAAAALGAVCLLVFAFQGPQCLANPLSNIPEDVDRLWLSQVNEARPLWAVGNDWLEFVPLTLGPPLLALYVLLRQIGRDKEDMQAQGLNGLWTPRVLLLIMLLASTALSIYQIRFNTFSYVIALIPLAAWVGEIYQRGKAKAELSETGSNVAYIGALALSVPLVWLLPAAVMQSKTAGDKPAEAAAYAQNCFSPALMEKLSALPVGTIASTSNGGTQILYNTAHRSLSGNYHRNLAGISAQIRLAAAAPEAAYESLKAAGVDYVHFCKGSQEAANLIVENPEGLYGALGRGEVPNYLSLKIQADDARIYAVSKN